MTYSELLLGELVRILSLFFFFPLCFSIKICIVSLNRWLLFGDLGIREQITHKVISHGSQSEELPKFHSFNPGSSLFRTICLLICVVESFLVFFFKQRLSFVLQSRFVTELKLGSGYGSLVNQFVVFASIASNMSAYLSV